MKSLLTAKTPRTPRNLLVNRQGAKAPRMLNVSDSGVSAKNVGTLHIGFLLKKTPIQDFLGVLAPWRFESTFLASWRLGGSNRLSWHLGILAVHNDAVMQN